MFVCAWEAGFTVRPPKIPYISMRSTARHQARSVYNSYLNVLKAPALSAGALAGGLLVAYLPPLMGYKILTLFAVS